MAHGRRLCVALVTATMLVGPVGDAGAAAPTVESRYDEGARKLDAKEYRAAIEIFHEVLDAAGDTKLGWKSLAGLGWAYEHLGNEPYAAEFYERFLAAVREHLTHGGTIDKDWRKPVRVFSKHLTRLQKNLAQTHGVITITSEPPGAIIRVDGKPARPRPVMTPYGLYVLAGPHEIVLELEGRQPHRQSVHVAVGDTVSVQAELPETPAPPDEPPGDVASPQHSQGAHDTAETRDEPVAAYALIGSGAALTVTGVVLLGLTVDANAEQSGLDLGQTDRFDELQDRKETFGIAAGVTGGVGLAILTVGVVLLVLDDSDEAPAVVVTPIPGGSAAAAMWRF